MNNNKTYTLLTLCVLIWSGNFIIGRFLGSDIHPLELAFFRWLFTIAFTLPILFFLDIKRILSVIKKNFLMMSFLAIMGISLFNTLLYIALQTTTATNALLINSIIPILILFFSFIILKTKITKVQTIGILLSTFGVIFLVLKGNLSNIFHLNFTKGDFWVIASSFSWAIYSTIVKLKPKGLSNLEFFIAIVYLGFIFLLPFYLTQNYTLEHEINVLKNNWYFFVYISLLASLASFYFWHIGIENIGADKTGQFTHLMPLFGATLAFIFLGEKIQAFHIMGACFIGFGIYLSLFFKKKIKI